MTKRILLLILLLGTLTACVLLDLPTPLPPVPTITPIVDETPADDWYTVYFTNPDDPSAGSFRGGPDSELSAAIRDAKLSIDAAIYHLNLWSIRDALIAAHESGVQVRVVMESDNLDEVEAQELKDAGIEVLGDRRESLMHNKFVVIDGAEVWTGSMNFTINGGYRNDNNLIHLRSTRLAENFTSEFEEMFSRDMFGDHIIANTPHSSLTIGGTQIETIFSPDDGAADRIVELIQNADESVHFMAFSFTSDDIAAAMIARHHAGVTVSGVFEEGQYYSNTGTEFDRLVDAGLDVRLDGNDRNMHHKIIIIDEAIVITGSYNFSRSAEVRNDENVVIVQNTAFAAEYLREFDRVFGKTK
jgi:phosphatidylserine/phosphatidylglycerophosphate/cardiolipin synthase-like enzyme